MKNILKNNYNYSQTQFQITSYVIGLVNIEDSEYSGKNFIKLVGQI